MKEFRMKNTNIAFPYNNGVLLDWRGPKYIQYVLSWIRQSLLWYNSRSFAIIIAFGVDFSVRFPYVGCYTEQCICALGAAGQEKTIKCDSTLFATSFSHEFSGCWNTYVIRYIIYVPIFIYNITVVIWLHNARMSLTHRMLKSYCIFGCYRQRIRCYENAKVEAMMWPNIY